MVLLNGLSRGRGAPVAQPQLLAATGLATALTAALGTTTSGAAFLGGQNYIRLFAAAEP